VRVETTVPCSRSCSAQAAPPCFFRHDTDERQPESAPPGSFRDARHERIAKRAPPGAPAQLRSVVDYGHDSIRAGMFAEQLDAGTGSGEFDRIAEQVDDRTRQKLAIAH